MWVQDTLQSNILFRMLYKHKKSHRKIENLLVALVNFGLKLNLDRNNCFSFEEIGFILLLKCLSGSPGE